MVEIRRRIFGLETEYGITCVLRGQRRLTPDEVARYLFRSVVAWGRSSNVFLENGGRLYLDVGSHPEFATPECDAFVDVIRYDKAGDAIINDLVATAENRLREEGIRGTIYLFKNNTDSAGNSYGCHENYLVGRNLDDALLERTFIPFLVSRQIFAGAGRIVSTSKGPTYSLSQRADHIWEGVSSATTRSRPIINTRDEPHADADLYRRLHVIVGDTNMSEYATYLKLGTAACVLRMMEADALRLPDFTLENPIRAIRDMSTDLSFRRTVRLLNGREVSAMDIQQSLVEAARAFADAGGFDPDETEVVGAWERTLELLETDPMLLNDRVDWVMKKQLLDRWMDRHNGSLDSPEAQMIDLQYHDIDPARGLYARLEARGLTKRVVSDDDVFDAKTIAPQTTRARLRGEFIRRAKERQRDFTVDWVHLKLNDQTQRTVVCKDPFKSRDERVERLIASL